MRKHAHILAWFGVWAAISFVVGGTCASVAFARVDGLGLEMPRHLGRKPKPKLTEVVVTSDEVLINLFVDRRGNVTSGLRIVEAVVFDVTMPPDGLSPRCAESVRTAVDGTRVVVCFTTDDLARFLYGDETTP